MGFLGGLNQDGYGSHVETTLKQGVLIEVFLIRISGPFTSEIQSNRDLNLRIILFDPLSFQGTGYTIHLVSIAGKNRQHLVDLRSPTLQGL